MKLGNKKIGKTWWIVLVFIVVMGVGIAVFVYLRTTHTVTPKKPVPIIVSPQALPTGVQSFGVSYGDVKDNKPRLSLITVDPMTPAKNAIQKIVFTAQSPLPIIQVASVIRTDHGQHPLFFTLTSGTPTNGTWTATWKMLDAYDKTYEILFHLVTKDSYRDDSLALR